MVGLNKDAIRMIEEIITRHGTAVVYHNKKGITVAEQTTKIKYRESVQSKERN